MASFLVFFLRPLPIAIAALLLFTSCSGEAERVYTVRGIVRAPYENGTLTIHHEEIPGFMPSMLMPFYADADEVRDLMPGDRVEFEFRVGETSMATKFRKLGSEPGASPATPPASGSVQRLREGDPMPAFELVDQDNRRLTQADLEGQFTVLTFIFTRCPVPEFCPLISRHFQTLQQALEERPALPPTRLLSISIDPEYDRPAVLRAYGEALEADFAIWDFATGETGEIERLNRLFAVHTERNAGTLDHTLATALIGPDGTVRQIWRGNGWKPAEVLDRLAGEAAETRQN